MSKSKHNSITPAHQPELTRPRRPYRTAEQWREIVQAFEQSSLSRAQFCEQYNITSSGLYNWQRKLAQRPKGSASRREDFIEIPPPPGVRESPQAWDVELELGAGRFLRVRAT